MKNKTAIVAFLVIGLCGFLAGERTEAGEKAKLRLFTWERGVGFQSPDRPEMKVYLWFYEWNMFQARETGQHTRGTHELPRQVNAQGTRAVIGKDDLRLVVEAGVGSADLLLRIKNRTDHDWGELAAIIPCFNPGPKETRNRQLANIDTYYHAADGLRKLKGREIHFNSKVRPLLDKISPQGKFVFSEKWPTARENANLGLIVRQSNNGRWVAGVAWDNFLSAQAHNPWECMHLSVRVGPLARGEEKTIRGKVYLFQGKKEDCRLRCLADFDRRNKKTETPKK